MPMDDSTDPDTDWEPPVASRHLELLSHLDSAGVTTWAERALRATLEAVENGSRYEKIAVTDAWTDGDDALCLLYAAPFRTRDAIVGIRRQRGDSDWDIRAVVADLPPRMAALVMRVPKDILDSDLETPTAPEKYGRHLADYISEPLGRVAEYLRYDADGIGWWGTLDQDLPSSTNNR